MGIDIVTMRDCASNYGIFKIRGSSGKIYKIEMSGSEGLPHCSCKAFEFSPENNKNCKHVSALWNGQACFYNPQWHGGIENPKHRPTGYTYDGGLLENSCPACDGPTVLVKRAV